jgi:hypothetical protein
LAQRELEVGKFSYGMGCPGASVRGVSGVPNMVAPQRLKGEEGVEAENPRVGRSKAGRVWKSR